MKFYDIADLAELLKTDESSILALAMAGDIPEPHFIGGRIVRWSEYDLDNWAANDCKPSIPTVSKDEWTKLRQANRCEFLAKYLDEEERNRAAVAPLSSTADKCTDAGAVADGTCNKTD